MRRSIVILVLPRLWKVVDGTLTSGCGRIPEGPIVTGFSPVVTSRLMSDRISVFFEIAWLRINGEISAIGEFAFVELNLFLLIHKAYDHERSIEFFFFNISSVSRAYLILYRVGVIGDIGLLTLFSQPTWLMALNHKCMDALKLGKRCLFRARWLDASASLLD